uniref:Uncharacterized protein n=1 Tax=Nelumbo nucifera TaxID=4432 RepID=A0A822ZQV0_NELNU|nr:TPA_asm: hypothetical protein HUJ06_017180 [Nelumbo nucifera]
MKGKGERGKSKIREEGIRGEGEGWSIRGERTTTAVWCVDGKKMIYPPGDFSILISWGEEKRGKR